MVLHKELRNDIRWMSEKYNGIRVFWDGSSLTTSNDKLPIPIPSEYLENFPQIHFEAVMWYVNFHLFIFRMDNVPSSNLMDACKREHWKNVKFLVFDAPTKLSEYYEERMKFLEANIYSK